MCSLRLAWTGEYDGLKRLVSEELKLDGIWEQPGGYKKIFTTSDELTSISWLKDKKTLTFEGKDSKQLKRMLCSVLIGENIVLDSRQADKSDKRKCSSQCPDYSLDIESLHSGQMVHGEAIQSLGESISNVNEVLSELKDFVYKNSKLNIETNIVDSICAGIVGEADQHIITDNLLITRDNINDTFGIADERVPEADQHTITHNLPATTVNNTIVIADECVSGAHQHNIIYNLPSTIDNDTIEIADERVSEAEQHNITNNLPTTITDNSTIIIADECVSEVDKHNITNNVPATTVNNTIIMTDEREWLGHLPLIEAPNPVPSKNLLYESTFNHTFRSRYNPEAPHQQFHKNKYNNRCIRKGQNFKRPVIHRNNPITPHFRWYQTNHHPPLRSERLTQSLEWETYLDFVHQMTTPYMHGRQKLTQFF